MEVRFQFAINDQTYSGSNPVRRRFCLDLYTDPKSSGSRSVFELTSQINHCKTNDYFSHKVTFLVSAKALSYHRLILKPPMYRRERTLHYERDRMDQ